MAPHHSKRDAEIAVQRLRQVAQTVVRIPDKACPDWPKLGQNTIFPDSDRVGFRNEKGPLDGAL